MIFKRANTRLLLSACLSAWALGACECTRDQLGGIPDAGKQPDPPDAAMPPPPAFPLNVGDKVK